MPQAHQDLPDRMAHRPKAYLHSVEFSLESDAGENCYNQILLDFAADDSFELGNEKITSVYTPGHTKGSTSYRIGNLMLVGDTVFADGIGRPDLADKAPEFAKYLYNTLNNIILHGPNDYII